MLFGIDSLYFWLAVIIISIAAEAATLGLCGIWFAAGGAAALVAATFGASIWMQLVIFVLLSAVMLLLVRPLLARGSNSAMITAPSSPHATSIPPVKLRHAFRSS